MADSVVRGGGGPTVAPSLEGDDMKEYEVEINGLKVTMQLDEEQAERLGGTPVKSAPSTPDKSAHEPPTKAQKSVANKSA